MNSRQNSEPLLEFRDVSRIFKTKDRLVNALLQVSICLRKGERTAVLGRSGCGKSTLLRLAAGLDKPSEGTVAFKGEPITAPSLERGMVFQEPRLLPWLTVEGNVSLGCRYMDRNMKRDKLEELMELVELPGMWRAYPKELSGGMAQRVGLVRALYTDPELLMLDEPMGALDITVRTRLQDNLLRLWEAKGTSVLLVTHDIDEAIFLSHRMLILGADGRISCEMPNTLGNRRERDSAEFNEARRMLRASLNRIAVNQDYQI